MQTTLRDIIFQMQQVTEGFRNQQLPNVNRKLVHGIVDLKNSIDILINVYKDIQDYEKQKEFANYIDVISSRSANKIEIKDQNFAKCY